MSRILKLILTLCIVLSIGGIFLKICFGQKPNGLHAESRPMFGYNDLDILVSLDFPKKKVGQLYKINLEGDILQPILVDHSDKNMPVFSRSKNKVAYVGFGDPQEGSSIWEYDVTTMSKKKVLDSRFLNIVPSFSEDESKITFVRSNRLTSGHMGGVTWRDQDIYYYDFKTDMIRSITSGSYYRALFPQFADQDKLILFCLQDQHSETMKSNRYLYKYDLASEQKEKMFEDGVVNFIVTKNGNRVLYVTDPDPTNKDRNFVLYDLKNKTKEIVFSTTLYPRSFDISYDEQKLLILSKTSNSRKNPFTLHVVDLDSRTISKVDIKTDTFKPKN